MKKIELSGQRFGRLTVLYETDQRRNNCVVWHCRCDCGEECDVQSNLLRNGSTRSCGCYRIERIKETNTGKSIVKNDLTGQSFGHLTAVSFVRGDIWLWQCDCGNMCRKRASSVRIGKTQSCGHALMERRRQRVTEDNVFQYYDGTSISMLKSAINGRTYVTNNTGRSGVSRRVYPSGKVVFRVRIFLRGKEKCIGSFGTLEEAVKARIEAENRYFGEVIDDFESTTK